MTTKQKYYLVSLIVMVLAFIGIQIYRYRQLCFKDALSKTEKKTDIIVNSFNQSSFEYEAARWLVNNMVGHESYNIDNNKQFENFLLNNPTKDYKKIWLLFNAANVKEPEVISDIQCIPTNIIISEIREAVNTWRKATWKKEINFDTFCKYILPYNIEKEPIVAWRKYYREKYAYLVRDKKTIEEAFITILKYDKEHFKVSNTFYPYDINPILLDRIGVGNCQQRAYHMVYIMRALGIPAAVDYTPYWSNYGSNGHFWCVGIKKGGGVITGIAPKDGYIDGVYDRIIAKDYKEKAFSCTIDSLKKIAKVFRKTFEPHKRDVDSFPDKSFGYLSDSHSVDVTSFYRNTTKNNIVNVDFSPFEKLYTCIFTQEQGWVPIAKARKNGFTTVDIGPLIHDNLIIICKYDNGTFEPVSAPIYIVKNKHPYTIIADKSHLEDIVLTRKYLLRSMWINRWSELIGTFIQTSNSKLFEANVKVQYTIDKLPKSQSIDIPLHDITDDYIRIFPKHDVFPVFAELHFIDKNGNVIPTKKYNIYTVGEGLTGDTIVTRKLQDDDLSTTFYKRFPFWIGFDVRSIKSDIKSLQIVMWNDENQILPGKKYELFYWDGKIWKSLGEQKAKHNQIIFNNVPRHALFLLRNYDGGKEERPFLWRNNKQCWM